MHHLSILPRRKLPRSVLRILGTLVVIAVQMMSAPFLLRCGADFVTPWLLYHTITLSLAEACGLCFVAALALEQHGTYPAGMYLCSYSVLVLCILLLRRHVSWYNAFSWHFIFLLSEMFVITLEVLIYWLNGYTFILYRHYFIVYVGIRMVCSYILSYIAYYKFWLPGYVKRQLI